MLKANRITEFALALVEVAFVLVGVAGLAGYLQFSSETLCALLLALTCWTLGTWYALTGTLFDVYPLFLGSAVVFSAGQALLENAHANPAGLLAGLFAEDELVHTLLLVFTGLSSLHLGALLVKRSNEPRIELKDTADRIWAKRVGWLLLLVSIVPSALWLRDATSIVSASGYASLYERDVAAGIAAGPLVLAGFLVPSCLLLVASSKARMSTSRFVGTTVIFLYAAIQLYLGFRSTAIMPIVAWAWLRHRLIKPLRFSVLAGASVVVLFVVFPTVREIRNVAADQRSYSTMIESYLSLDNPAVTSVAEMGGTMGTIAYTVRLVPSTRNFDWGIGYAYAALTILPNLFWEIHPTIAHGTANEWLVKTIDPWLAGRGGAYGYSFIAEAYLNFGDFGVPVMMLFLGIGLARLSIGASKATEPLALALFATFLAFTLRFPRDESASMIRAVIWYSFGPYVLARCAPAVIGL